MLGEYFLKHSFYECRYFVFLHMFKSDFDLIEVKSF